MKEINLPQELDFDSPTEQLVAIYEKLFDQRIKKKLLEYPVYDDEKNNISQYWLAGIYFPKVKVLAPFFPDLADNFIDYLHNPSSKCLIGNLPPAEIIPLTGHGRSRIYGWLTDYPSILNQKQLEKVSVFWLEAIGEIEDLSERTIAQVEYTKKFKSLKEQGQLINDLAKQTAASLEKNIAEESRWSDLNYLHRNCLSLPEPETTSINTIETAVAKLIESRAIYDLSTPIIKSIIMILSRWQNQILLSDEKRDFTITTILEKAKERFDEEEIRREAIDYYLSTGQVETAFQLWCSLSGSIPGGEGRVILLDYALKNRDRDLWQRIEDTASDLPWFINLKERYLALEKERGLDAYIRNCLWENKTEEIWLVPEVEEILRTEEILHSGYYFITMASQLSPQSPHHVLAEKLLKEKIGLWKQGKMTDLDEQCRLLEAWVCFRSSSTSSSTSGVDPYCHLGYKDIL